MYQSKIIPMFFIVCSSLFMMKCDGNRNIFKRSTDTGLQCDKYANDLEILSTFPFTMGLDYKQQGPDKSTAILDSTNTSVIMIQLRKAGGVVPENVFCLKNLEALDIMNMNFVNGIVPDTLANLQKVHTLSMTNTPIKKMTNKLATLGNLRSLTLDKCSLASLPNLNGLYNLTSVTLPNNQLTKLEGLYKLTSLTLYKNLFTEIPALEVPEALSRLDMNFNPVIDMSVVTSFSNITSIRLSETLIPFIPEDMNELEKLNNLELSNTRITYLPRNLFTMPRLQYLIVQRNSFSQEELDLIKTELNKKQSKMTLLI